VRLGCDVPDAGHFEASCLERADRGLAAGARTLDEHLDPLKTVLDPLSGGSVGGDLSSDLREPLNPAPPADSQAITLPSRSVRDTIVLLNEVLTWA
jgi:hypothetical protein